MPVHSSSLLLMVNCIAMAHFSFCRGLTLDDYVSARPSYFKTIYNAYIDIAILGMLYILLYTLLHHAIYTTLRTTITLFIRFGLSRIVEKNNIYFSSHQCLMFPIVSIYLLNSICRYISVCTKIIGYGLTFYLFYLNQGSKLILSR